MGRITQRTIESIQERLPISAVVSKTVQLKRAGREWKGLSPRTREKTASLYVNDQKGMAFDFSAGVMSNIFDWVMEFEGLAFPDAVERLAAEAGVEVTREGLARETRESQQAREEAFAAMECAQRFFEDQLFRYTPAHDYLRARGITGRTARDFGIGWAPPPGRCLINHLCDEGFSPATILQCGLARQDDGKIRPFFAGRITFPIRNRQGRVIAFGARSIEGSLPKYINSPQTPLFDKGSAIFHLDQARRAIARSGHAILLEGYFDVAAVCQAGIENVCATMGTALSVEQLHKLWRVCPHIVACYDGDAAGSRAADKALETALPWLASDRRFSVARLPAGFDPDDLVRTSGVAAFTQVTRSAEHPTDSLWRVLRAENPGADPASIAALETGAKSRLAVVSDETMRRAMLDSLRDRIRGLRTGKTGSGAISIARRAVAAIPAREAALVLAAVLHPAYVEHELEAFATAEVRAPLCQQLRDLVVGRVSDGEPIDVESVARDVAILRSALPDPEPSFVARVDLGGFREALQMQAAQSARRRLSSLPMASAIA